jgi:hypothetical protein
MADASMRWRSRRSGWHETIMNKNVCQAKCEGCFGARLTLLEFLPR